MRKAALLFAAMVASLLVAGGIAQAESQLDQEQTSHDTFWTVSRWGLLVGQTFTAGVSGQLDRVSILAGCCADRNEVLRRDLQPPGDVLVEIHSVDDATGLPTEEVLGSGREPASSLPANGSLGWVDVALDPAAGVEAGERYALVVSSSENGITRGAWYAWGIVYPSAYSGGAFAVARRSGDTPCQPLGGWVWDDLLESDDAAFRTFVAPGTPTPPPEDTAPPDTCVSGGPSDLTNDNTPTFTFFGSDNVSVRTNLVYSYKVDDGDWSAYSPARSVTLGDASGLPDGAHTFYLKARDEAGNEDATPAERSFEVDATAPIVSGVEPVDGATRVPRGTDVTATFSEEMNPCSIHRSTFKLYKWNKEKRRFQQVTNVGVNTDTQQDCATLPDTKTVVLDPYPAAPSKLLARDTKYQAVITTGVRDPADNPLARDSVWSFRTGSR